MEKGTGIGGEGNTHTHTIIQCDTYDECCIHTHSFAHIQFQSREKLQRCNTKERIRFTLLHIGVTRDTVHTHAHIRTSVQYIHVDAVT